MVLICLDNVHKTPINIIYTLNIYIFKIFHISIIHSHFIYNLNRNILNELHKFLIKNVNFFFVNCAKIRTYYYSNNRINHISTYFLKSSQLLLKVFKSESQKSKKNKFNFISTLILFPF